MDYEDLVEDPDAPTPEPVEDEQVATPEPVKQKPGWKAVIVTGLLAGLLGTGGGAAAVYFGVKHQTPDMTAVKADLRRQMTAEMSTLETRVASVETLAQDAVNRPISTPSSSSVDLAPLQDRVAALEAQPSPDIDPDALAALQAAQADGFKWPDTKAMEARLAKLETRPSPSTKGTVSPDMLLEMADRIDTLEARPKPSAAAMPTDLMARIDALETASAVKVEPAIPTGLMARLEALENKPAPIAEKQIVPLLAFPKAAMLKAVEDTNKGGFIQRTLSKHVRVKEDDDPRTLIAEIEEHLSKGRLDLAANKYDRLPSPVQEVGRAWYNSLKAAQ